MRSATRIPRPHAQVPAGARSRPEQSPPAAEGEPAAQGSGRWRDVLRHLDVAVSVAPSYAEAHREKGIAENKVWWGTPNPPPDLPDGEASLRRAIELNPDDFDALSSLGGVLKRKEKWTEASDLYEQATRVSHGHPYPMLNALKLARPRERRAATRRQGSFPSRTRGVFAPSTGRERPSLQRPLELLRPRRDPPLPRRLPGVHEVLRDGVRRCTVDWQPRTFRESLELLIDGGIDLPGLADGVGELREAERRLEAP
jgi:tetratricopeptide (TPR) repeat protein